MVGRQAGMERGDSPELDAGWRRIASDGSVARRGPLFLTNYDGPDPSVSLVSRQRRTSASPAVPQARVGTPASKIYGTHRAKSSKGSRRGPDALAEAKVSPWCKNFSLPFSTADRDLVALDTRAKWNTAVRIQATFRAYLDRRRASRAQNMVVKIQRIVRGFLCRFCGAKHGVILAAYRHFTQLLPLRLPIAKQRCRVRLASEFKARFGALYRRTRAFAHKRQAEHYHEILLNSLRSLHFPKRLERALLSAQLPVVAHAHTPLSAATDTGNRIYRQTVAISRAQEQIERATRFFDQAHSLEANQQTTAHFEGEQWLRRADEIAGFSKHFFRLACRHGASRVDEAGYSSLLHRVGRVLYPDFDEDGMKITCSVEFRQVLREWNLQRKGATSYRAQSNFSRRLKPDDSTAGGHLPQLQNRVAQQFQRSKNQSAKSDPLRTMSFKLFHFVLCKLATSWVGLPTSATDTSRHKIFLFRLLNEVTNRVRQEGGVVMLLRPVGDVRFLVDIDGTVGHEDVLAQFAVQDHGEEAVRDPGHAQATTTDPSTSHSVEATEDVEQVESKNMSQVSDDMPLQVVRISAARSMQPETNGISEVNEPQISGSKPMSSAAEDTPDHESDTAQSFEPREYVLGAKGRKGRRIKCELIPAVPKYLRTRSALTQSKFHVPDFQRVQQLQREAAEAAVDGVEVDYADFAADDAELHEWLRLERLVAQNRQELRDQSATREWRASTRGLDDVEAPRPPTSPQKKKSMPIRLYHVANTRSSLPITRSSTANTGATRQYKIDPHSNARASRSQTAPANRSVNSVPKRTMTTKLPTLFTMPQEEKRILGQEIHRARRNRRVRSSAPLMLCWCARPYVHILNFLSACVFAFLNSRLKLTQRFKQPQREKRRKARNS